MTKKSLLLMLSLVLALTIGLGSTLAYLTDSDAEVNTFTIGDVDIDLVEEYKKDQTINPGVEVEKEVHIENTGDNEAWVWYTVALPLASDAEDAPELIVPTYNEGSKWFKQAETQNIELDGAPYRIYTFLWGEKLAAGAATDLGLTDIKLDEHIDYDPVTDTYKFIEAGEEKGSIDYDLTAGKVYVNAFAIQTEGFDTVADGYNAFMGQWTEDGKTFTEGMINAGSVEIPVRTLWSDSADTAWYDAAATSYELDTAEELAGLAVLVNEEGVNFKGKTITLTADVDLGDNLWIPIGQTGATEFKGVFDGGEKTISNLIVNSDDQTNEHYSSGLFGWLENHGEGIVIKNVVIDGAKITGHHNCGVVVGYVYGTIENCTVKNSEVICTHVNGDICGDKAGAIAGYAGDGTFKNNSAENCKISAARDAGQLFGCVIKSQLPNYSGNTATNVTVEANADSTGCSKYNTNINNDIYGRIP